MSKTHWLVFGICAVGMIFFALLIFDCQSDLDFGLCSI